MVKVTNFKVNSSNSFSATVKTPEGGQEEKFERRFKVVHVKYTQQNSIVLKTRLNMLSSNLGKVTNF